MNTQEKSIEFSTAPVRHRKVMDELARCKICSRLCCCVKHLLEHEIKHSQSDKENICSEENRLWVEPTDIILATCAKKIKFPLFCVHCKISVENETSLRLLVNTGPSCTSKDSHWIVPLKKFSDKTWDNKTPFEIPLPEPISLEKSHTSYCKSTPPFHFLPYYRQKRNMESSVTPLEDVRAYSQATPKDTQPPIVRMLPVCTSTPQDSGEPKPFNAGTSTSLVPFIPESEQSINVPQSILSSVKNEVKHKGSTSRKVTFSSNIETTEFKSSDSIFSDENERKNHKDNFEMISTEAAKNDLCKTAENKLENNVQKNKSTEWKPGGNPKEEEKIEIKESTQPKNFKEQELAQTKDDNENSKYMEKNSELNLKTKGESSDQSVQAHIDNKCIPLSKGVNAIVELIEENRNVGDKEKEFKKKNDDKDKALCKKKSEELFEKKDDEIKKIWDKAGSDINIEEQNEQKDDDEIKILYEKNDENDENEKICEDKDNDGKDEICTEKEQFPKNEKDKIESNDAQEEQFDDSKSYEKNCKEEMGDKLFEILKLESCKSSQNNQCCEEESKDSIKGNEENFQNEFNEQNSSNSDTESSQQTFYSEEGSSRLASLHESSIEASEQLPGDSSRNELLQKQSPSNVCGISQSFKDVLHETSQFQRTKHYFEDFEKDESCGSKDSKATQELPFQNKRTKIEESSSSHVAEVKSIYTKHRESESDDEYEFSIPETSQSDRVNEDNARQDWSFTKIASAITTSWNKAKNLVIDKWSTKRNNANSEDDENGIHAKRIKLSPSCTGDDSSSQAMPVEWKLSQKPVRSYDYNIKSRRPLPRLEKKGLY